MMPSTPTNPSSTLQLGPYMSVSILKAPFAAMLFRRAKKLSHPLNIEVGIAHADLL